MLEWLSAIGSFGQFIVVAAAAFFAVGQLRQIRRQVDLQSIQPFLDKSHSEEFDRFFDAVRRLHDRGPDIWRDPAVWESEDFRLVVRFALVGNEIGILVAARLVHDELIVSPFRPFFLMTWEIVGPWLAVRRHGKGSTSVPIFAAFESLVVRMTADGFVDRFAQMRAALPPPARIRYDESRQRIQALYDALQRSDASP